MLLNALDERLEALRRWLATQAAFDLDLDDLQPASSDASFRRYFRIGVRQGAHLIAMDAPPAHEDCRPFVAVAAAFAAAGVSVPTVLACNLDDGFLLLSDLGRQTYLDVLQHADAALRARLIDDALIALNRIQTRVDAQKWPDYDRVRLVGEMQLFIDWYLTRHCGVELSSSEQNMLAALFDQLASLALAQHQVSVHRDYHSRNLMRLAADQLCGNPGVLDFQDAVRGPITYDLVSLLRDAYVAWPEEQILDWVVRFWERARAAKHPVAADFAEFWMAFELMGLQRHLKVLGIFARLSHRDGKHGYLDDLPLVLHYVRAVAARYRLAGPLLKLLDRASTPTLSVGYTF